MRGSALLILILLFTLLWHNSRWSHPERVETPAVMRSGPNVVSLALSGEGGLAGVHQYNDGVGVDDVIKLTNKMMDTSVVLKAREAAAPKSGESFKIALLDGEVVGFERNWMSASHRMLLGIPLHPDHMSVADWESLPGIGPKLAAAIELDRQKNGDFLIFEALDRVKGVGPKKLKQWKPLFLSLTDPMKEKNTK